MQEHKGLKSVKSRNPNEGRNKVSPKAGLGIKVLQLS